MNREQLAKAINYWKKNPVEAIKDWFGVTPENYQGDILTELLVPKGRAVTRTAIKSGHGVGKTTTLSWAIWHFMMTRRDARIPCTAPTQNQLGDVLWPEIAKWHQKFPDEFRSLWDISATHVRYKKSPKTWFAAARTSNKPENLQGFHNEHVLVVCEEASGVPPNIFEVIEGIMTNAEEEDQEALLLMVGNPTQTSGEFYNAFHKNKKLYSRFTISGGKIPPQDKNGGRIYISPRVSDKYRNVMASKYGENSPIYDVRVTGIFPRLADDVVIPLDWAEKAQFTKLPRFDRVKHELTLVMDVARFGGDETTLATIREGHVLSLKAWPKTSINQCCDILWEAYFERGDGLTVGRIIVDEPGVGGGVIDVARRMGMPITPYNGGRPMRKGFDPDEDVRMFANVRSRDWWYARRKFERQQIHIPTDEELVNQLASVKYDYFNEKIKVESKKDMRERLGEDASPDRADTIIMGVAPIYSIYHGDKLDVSDISGLDGCFWGKDRPQGELDLW